MGRRAPQWRPMVPVGSDCGGRLAGSGRSGRDRRSSGAGQVQDGAALHDPALHPVSQGLREGSNRALVFPAAHSGGQHAGDIGQVDGSGGQRSTDYGVERCQQACTVGTGGAPDGAPFVGSIHVGRLPADGRQRCGVGVGQADAGTSRGGRALRSHGGAGVGDQCGEGVSGQGGKVGGADLNGSHAAVFSVRHDPRKGEDKESFAPSLQLSHTFKAKASHPAFKVADPLQLGSLARSNDRQQTLKP